MILDKAGRVSKSKGFAAKLAVTSKQADVLIDLLTATVAALGKVKSGSRHENTRSCT